MIKLLFEPVNWIISLHLSWPFQSWNCISPSFLRQTAAETCNLKSQLQASIHFRAAKAKITEDNKDDLQFYGKPTCPVTVYSLLYQPFEAIPTAENKCLQLSPGFCSVYSM